MYHGYVGFSFTPVSPIVQGPKTKAWYAKSWYADCVQSKVNVRRGVSLSWAKYRGAANALLGM